MIFAGMLTETTCTIKVSVPSEKIFEEFHYKPIIFDFQKKIKNSIIVRTFIIT